MKISGKREELKLELSGSRQESTFFKLFWFPAKAFEKNCVQCSPLPDSIHTVDLFQGTSPLSKERGPGGKVAQPPEFSPRPENINSGKCKAIFKG